MKKVLFIGQAPPVTMEGAPFKTTGLFRWLLSVDIIYESRKDFKIFHNQEGVFIVDGKEKAIVKFSALIDFFPGHAKNGGHLAPTPEQIKKSNPTLRKLIKKFKPDVIVPVGKLSSQQALGLEEVKLQDIIGKEFLVDTAYGIENTKYRVIPLPHPSGASSWVHMPQNTKHFGNALQLLRESLD